jgi:hypothetical protein
MTRFDIENIADTILAAPGWARIGITAPTSHIRSEAAQELARVIADKLAQPPSPDRGSDQPGFAL